MRIIDVERHCKVLEQRHNKPVTWKYSTLDNMFRFYVDELIFVDEIHNVDDVNDET